MSGPTGPTRADVLRRGRLRPPSDAPADGETTDRLVGGDHPDDDDPDGGDDRTQTTAIVEQILSGRVGTPVDYLSSRSEWVTVLHGHATIDVGGETVDLTAGDWVVLPANAPHRLLEVAEGTSWLAFHFPV